MALIKCKECGHMISSKAEQCPNCGYINKRRRNKAIIIGIVILLLIICLIVSFILLYKGIKQEDNKQLETMDKEINEQFPYKNITSTAELNDAINDKESIILLAQTTCSYCEQFNPVLNKVKNDYDLNVYVIVVDTLDSDVFNEMMSMDNGFGDYFEENTNWGTPLLLLFDKGNFIDDVSGYTEEDNLISILSNDGFI